VAKKQTRKSISIKAGEYDLLKRHCDKQGIPLSAYVETLIAERLDREGIPKEE